MNQNANTQYVAYNRKSGKPVAYGATAEAARTSAARKISALAMKDIKVKSEAIYEAHWGLRNSR